MLALCTPQIKRRKKTPGLQKSIVAKINLLLDEPESEVEETVPEELRPCRTEKRGRCSTCLESIHGTGYREKFKKICGIRSQCQVCKNVTCDKHLKKLCCKCYRNMKH